MMVFENILSWRTVAIAIAICLSAFTQACDGDNFNKTIQNELTPVIPFLPADTGPDPGDGGLITIGGVTTTQVQLFWTEGSDGETPQEDLQYKVYRSTLNNISTPALAEIYGDDVTDWTPNITGAVSDGLWPGTTYYFVVVVRDDDFNTATYRTVSVTTLGGSNELPVPGNGGIITMGAVSGTSVQLNWTRAEDVQTPQTGLRYRVYRSESNNISTPALALANGFVVVNWTYNIVSAVSDGLIPGRNYYFNVVVLDGDENSAAYVTISVTTSNNSIYMFAAERHTGDLTTPTTASARADIDEYCANAKSSTYPTLPCLNIRAFISISTTDYIAYMPTSFLVPTDRRIIGPTGTEIATNWADLLDGSIMETLNKADIAQNKWWSGSDSAGNYIRTSACVGCNTCTGWTVGTNASQGLTGTTNATGSTWIYDLPADNCNNSRHVLCVCW